ncbi:MAG: response regulator [Elusimicrobia bacterium]|nr:response regulator [Elusimicrobiota bacterium]
MSKILIVDDSEANRDILKLRLEHAGYEVLSAVDGEEGLKMVALHAPDLVILDVMMPKVDGWLACRCLKGDPKTKAIPVIMLTARTQETDELRGWECGAEEYLTKPCDTARLLAAVGGLLARAAGEGR